MAIVDMRIAHLETKLVMRTFTYTAPAHWAGVLLGGDWRGFPKREEREVLALLASLKRLGLETVEAAPVARETRRDCPFATPRCNSYVLDFVAVNYRLV